MKIKNVSSKVGTTSLSSDGRYTQSGEFGDINDNMSSFYQDLNKEKSEFNQYIFNFNKYYQNKYNNNENNTLEINVMKINSFENFLNNF